MEALHAPRRHEAALFQASINALLQWPDVRLIAKGVEQMQVLRKELWLV